MRGLECVGLDCTDCGRDLEYGLGEVGVGVGM